MRHTGLLTGLTLAIALGGLGNAVEAQQQGGMGHGQGMGMGMDRGMQGDGPADMAERFGEADADGDGKVGRDEMVARMTERATARIEAQVDRMIARHDGDDDGMLTLDEMQSGMGGRMFDQIDADGDGAVSRDEFAKMREMMRQGKGRNMHHGYRHGDDKGMPHRGMGKGGMMQGDVIIHHHYYDEK
jgi:Ca2+-binding EF-hand superfamily protein